jgi:hypothetical protein
MGQPFDLLNAILSGLIELARSKERAAQRNAAVIFHCFTLEAVRAGSGRLSRWFAGLLRDADDSHRVARRGAGRHACAARD